MGQFLYCILYLGKFRIFERDRTRGTPDEEWPWETMPVAEWRQFFRRSLFLNLLNSFMTNPLITLTMHLAGAEDLSPTAIDRMPVPHVFLAQLMFCMVMEDFTFYIGHRVLHIPFLYKNVHKIHHEHKVTFCMAAIHAHPLEYAIANIIPVLVGPLILGPHIHRASVFGWYFMRGWESMEGHSGYGFCWSPFRLIPFSPDGDYHFFHHSANVGCYATFFTWWDTILGTNSVYYKQKKD